MLHELPLVIFTIAAQMSVGSFIVLGLIQLFGARVPAQTMNRVTDPALYAIGPLLVFGLAASTLHLGSPLRAINALNHLSSSWLSREILAGVIFAGFGAAFAVTQWFKLFSHRIRQTLALLTAVVGVVLVYCISQVYSLRTVPAWMYLTPLRFFTTTFLLGGLAVATALVVARSIRARRGDSLDAPGMALLTSSVRGISLLGIAALGVKFVGQPAYVAYLGTHDSVAAHKSLELLAGEYGGFAAAQNILVVLGVGALAFLLYRLSGRNVNPKLLPIVSVIAFALVLAGEVIGRMLFYAVMVRQGL